MDIPRAKRVVRRGIRRCVFRGEVGDHGSGQSRETRVIILLRGRPAVSGTLCSTDSTSLMPMLSAGQEVR
jgi:hypothetical protein